MLKVSGLSVNYGQISALRDISFEVGDNEIVALIGANGAGKTTTLMAISGLVEKTDGKICFRDKDITAEKPHLIVRKGISHIPEGRHVFPALSVEENLIMGTLGNIKMTSNAINDRIEQMYELFPRLKERCKQSGGTLSGGEQQMLAIARGLMGDPQLLMLDEPSLGLAPIIVEEIFELILKIKDSGRTILLIEQNANLSLQIADRGFVMETGVIVTSGTGAELLEDPEIRRAYLGA
jgi:branched-chain amino acid transport system ATP-binding protein